MPLLSIKLHKTPKENLLAVCDLEILGGKFSDGEKRIEVYRSFYGGDVIDENSLSDHLRNATIVNLVGERAVGKAIELGYVNSDRVLRIGNTLHAQFATMHE